VALGNQGFDKRLDRQVQMIAVQQVVEVQQEREQEA
jgi:hypothetical protein